MPSVGEMLEEPPNSSWSRFDSLRIVSPTARVVIAKFITNRQRDPLRSVAQRRVIKVNVAVGRAGPPVPK